MKITPMEQFVNTAAPHVAAETLGVIKAIPHGAQFTALCGAESCAESAKAAQHAARQTP